MELGIRKSAIGLLVAVCVRRCGVARVGQIAASGPNLTSPGIVDSQDRKYKMGQLILTPTHSMLQIPTLDKRHISSPDLLQQIPSCFGKAVPISAPK